MSNLEQNERLLRIVTTAMNNIIREEESELSKRFLNDCCDMVRSLEYKIHLAKLDIAIEEGDFNKVDSEREAIELWKEKER